jgi:8-oxo-dGTP pyrophosphatase MutT (NUDIX family)
MASQSPTGRPDPSKPTVLITSAGGVVMDRRERVLLLKRRVESTWVLPKGRVEEGETLTSTALREVAEESGLEDLAIKRKIGLVRYTFYWRPEEVNYKKTVHYFLMKLDGDSAEVALEPDFVEFTWARIEEAVKLLTFENDRRIVRSLF